jgi:DNA-binding response OmpR family regulator
VKVLLVADNPRVADQVRVALEGPSLHLVQVARVARAVALLDAEDGAGDTFDVVIGDADLVPEGGFALAREIRARGQMGRSVPPVVLLVARPPDRFLSDWSQAHAYVAKPADPFDLAETVATVVAGTPLPVLPGVGGAPVPSLLDRHAQAAVAEVGAGS